VAIPAKRIPRQTAADRRSETIATRQWWDAFALEWTWIACCARAELAHAERALFIQLWNHRNALVRMLNTTSAMRGQRAFPRNSQPHGPLLVELQRELSRTEDECREYGHGFTGDRPRAFDGEMEPEDTARRLMVEAGVTPNRLRRSTPRDRRGERLANDLRATYCQHLEYYRAQLADVRDPPPTRVYRSDVAAQLEKNISVLEAKLSALVSNENG
jgi:hypothetical protein